MAQLYAMAQLYLEKRLNVKNNTPAGVAFWCLWPDSNRRPVVVGKGE